MNILDLERRLGVSPLAYERLLEGEIPEGVAVLLKTSVKSVQNLVSGESSSGVAAAMGCPIASLETLRRQIGREGAIGLVIGLAVAARLRE